MKTIKIYYLDDEVELGNLFSDFFQDDRVEIKVFSEPDLALRIIHENPPDLLFLDYRLPNTNGDKIALQLGPEIPKALITGELTVELQAPFQKVFKKPYEIDLIQSYIDSFIGTKQEGV